MLSACWAMIRKKTVECRVKVDEETATSNLIRSIATREAKVPRNMHALLVLHLDHTLLPQRSWRGTRTIDTLALHRARADTHLSTLLYHCATRTAAVRRVRDRAVELVVNEWASSRYCGLVDDACPDGGQREEDAHDGEDLGAELGDSLLELEAGEDG